LYIFLFSFEIVTNVCLELLHTAWRWLFGFLKDFGNKSSDSYILFK